MLRSRQGQCKAEDLPSARASHLPDDRSVFVLLSHRVAPAWHRVLVRQHEHDYDGSV